MSRFEWPLPRWIMDKIANYLVKEGCQSTAAEPTIDGMKLTLTDSFGFVYELNIKTISRIQTNYAEVNLYDQNDYKRTEGTR